MPEPVRPPRASARSCWPLLAGAALAACVPLQDLDDYARPPAAAGAAGTSGSPGSEQPSTDTPAEQPQVVGDVDGEPPTPSLPLQGVSSGSDQDPTREGEPGPAPPADAGAPADAAPDSPCADQELLAANGHCHFIEPALLSWSAARAACQSRGPGWDLASVLSATDGAFLGDTLELEAWIGASDLASEGSWTWAADGRVFWTGGQSGAAVGGAYANWNATEPNGGTTTNCARALPRSFGAAIPDAPWADLDCAQLRGSVCEAHPTE